MNGGRTVVLLSGGLDSTVLAYHEKRVRRNEVIALSVFYGQRHAAELRSAAAVSNALGVELVHVDLGSALRPVFSGSGSSQVDGSVVPEGHYADDNMKTTVVPNRNMILLATATALAVSRRADTVAYAAHAGDHAQYPDCREEFISRMGAAMAFCDWEPIHLIAPFSDWDKAQIARHGFDLGAPLGLTRSCYQVGEDDVNVDAVLHCGRCGTCVERAEAFHLAGVPDPTNYADADFWKTVTNRSER